MNTESNIRRTPARTDRAARALARLEGRDARPAQFAAGFSHGSCRWDAIECPVSVWSIGVESMWGCALVEMEDGFVTVHAYEGLSLSDVLEDRELLVQWSIDVAPSIAAPGAATCWIDRATFSDRERVLLGVSREGLALAGDSLETDALSALCLTAKGLRAPRSVQLAS